MLNIEVLTGDSFWSKLPSVNLPQVIFDGQHWECKQIKSNGDDAYYDVRFFDIFPDKEEGYWHISATVCGKRNGAYKDTLKRPVASKSVPYFFAKWELDPSLVKWSVKCHSPLRSAVKKTKRTDQPSVYFIVSDESSTVKIGWAFNPEKRCRELQTGSPFYLRVAATILGGQGEEAALHNQFAHLRVRSNGEWFYLKDELAAHLEKLVGAEHS